MNFANMKLLYKISCIGLGLIILSPTIFAVASFPESEKFSELWILGSNHMAESTAFEITANNPESVFLGVGNHMGELEYYAVFVKFHNQSEPISDYEVGLPSSSETIFEYRMFLNDNEVWEKNFVFSFEDISFEDTILQVSKFAINGYDVNVDKTVAWDDEFGGFYCQLSFELWIYNPTTSSFQFHNRAVWFWVTVSETL